MGYSMTDISQPPPPTNNCSVEGTYANRHMVAVMKNLIGPKTLVGMTKSNIELPGNGEACRSAVCSDAYDDVLPSTFVMSALRKGARSFGLASTSTEKNTVSALGEGRSKGIVQ
jgi:hypothetical protein